jgi:hypothetical protein
MKTEEIRNRRERIEKERRGIGKMLIFGIVILIFVIRNPKARRANQAFIKNIFLIFCLTKT